MIPCRACWITSVDETKGKCYCYKCVRKAFAVTRKYEVVN